MPKPTRKRKQKSKKSDQHGGSGSFAKHDSNILKLHPLPKADRDEKRRQLEVELKARQPKISREKQKRLNKYIVSSPALLEGYSSDLIQIIGKETKEG